MRFGVATTPAQPFEALRDPVRFAEELGCPRAWIPDQSFFKGPFAILGALAGHTRRMGLALGVVNAYRRHPVPVARGAATPVELTGGWFLLAYGAGNRRELLKRLDLERAHGGARCCEALHIVRSLPAGEEVSQRGGPWPLHGVPLQFPPGLAGAPLPSGPGRGGAAVGPLHVPQGAGLGIALDEAKVAKYRGD